MKPAPQHCLRPCSIHPQFPGNAVCECLIPALLWTDRCAGTFPVSHMEMRREKGEGWRRMVGIPCCCSIPAVASPTQPSLCAITESLRSEKPSQIMEPSPILAGCPCHREGGREEAGGKDRGPGWRERTPDTAMKTPQGKPPPSPPPRPAGAHQTHSELNKAPTEKNDTLFSSFSSNHRDKCYFTHAAR